MENPAPAARTLAEEVESNDAVYQVAPDDLSSDPDDGWVAVGGIVRSPDGGRIALVRTSWSDGWVLPGGGVEPGDGTFEATLRREVREETGLDVTVRDPLLVERQTLATPDRSSSGWFVVYDAVAEDESFADDPGEHDAEIEAVSWFADPASAFGGPSEFVREVVRRELAGE